MPLEREEPPAAEAARGIDALSHQSGGVAQQPSLGWFKAVRNPEALELIAANPSAFVLLYVSAFRANRQGGFNRHGLAPGQAMVGDFEKMGLSERQYRTAKQFLQKHGFATFKATNKGTIATLTGTRVFDISIAAPDDQNDRRPTDRRRTGDGQPTTNKEVKTSRLQEGGEHASPVEVQEPRAARPEPNYPETPTLEEFNAYAELIGLPAKWYVEDKFLAAEASQWQGKTNWRSYCQRCRKWWEQDGRPMSPPTPGQGRGGASAARQQPPVKTIFEKEIESVARALNRIRSEAP